MRIRLKLQDNPQHLALAADLVRCLANPYRLRIVEKIWRKEASVGELSSSLSLSQSALSQHLAILRASNIVSTRRHMQTIYYTLSSPAAVEVLEALQDIFSEERAAERTDF